jgi:2-oxoisovalerate dehydrogenase E1 component
MRAEEIKRSIQAFELLVTAKEMTHLYEREKSVTSKYVHATSRGHEGIQIAMGLHLEACDFVFPYYRDDAMLLSMGLSPYDLMLQLLAKKEDEFSGGRTYYSHPSLNRPGFPKIPHQSSATGMQAIPAAGVALGLQYRALVGLDSKDTSPIVVCSMGDASCTEGEVSEAFQMAALKKLPILFLIQDNGWNISAKGAEYAAQGVSEFYGALNGITVYQVDGTDFPACDAIIREAVQHIRKVRGPVLVQAKVPLLNHHTSGVRKEWYRDDLEEAAQNDPYDKLKSCLLEWGVSEVELMAIEDRVTQEVASAFDQAMLAEEPSLTDLETHVFAPTTITEEAGERAPAGGEKVVMVDAALFAIREIMEKHTEALLYGQDVGARLGGVFREAATLAKQFGDHRVFNTPIQEAFIIGSTVGMSAVGLKPMVEVQFADYIWPGLNQLFTEVSRSCYLSNGKWPVSMVLRVPIGAYGSGGPYHSSSVESVLTAIKGIKIAYPSNGADLKGLLKAAYYDPNPTVILEHKGLYWSKIKGTEEAACIEPSADYVLPFGKARSVLEVQEPTTQTTAVVITYGMGVYWAKEAAKQFPNRIEILDLRTLAPLDESAVLAAVKRHGRCLLLTEEPTSCSFAQSLAGWISEKAFQLLDAPVRVLGSKELPAIPLNAVLEAAMLPNASKTANHLEELLTY